GGRGARIERGLADAIEDRRAQPIIGGRTLGVGDRAGGDIAGDQIGEGSADVDGDHEGHVERLSLLGYCSILIPALLITSAHCGMRVSSMCVTSAGVPIRGSTPAACSRWRTSLSSSACRSSVWSRSMISAGGPAGANTP